MWFTLIREGDNLRTCLAQVIDALRSSLVRPPPTTSPFPPRGIFSPLNVLLMMTPPRVHAARTWSDPAPVVVGGPHDAS